MNNTPAHVIISWVFLILIGMVFGYSYFFYPESHPIPCLLKQYTGKDCSSCGFSRAFSAFIHLDIQKGHTFNKHAAAVFLFFLFQLIVRATILFFYYFKKKNASPSLVNADILISISAFLLAFLPLLINF